MVFVVINSAMEKYVEALEKMIKNIPRLISQRLRPYSIECASIIEAVDIDAPLTLSFCLLCIIVQSLAFFFGDKITMNYFAVPSWNRFYIYKPISYFTMFTQTIGHSTWSHLYGNIVHILLVGPACEREFGMFSMIKIMSWTAVVSSLTHILLGPSNTLQLGASGIVFMFILLNSLLDARAGRIPLTFLCQVTLWCYKEIFAHLFSSTSGVSHLAHLSGALVGTAAGYYLHTDKVKNIVKKAAQYWQNKLD